MVVRRHWNESVISVRKTELPLALDVNLPAFDVAQVEHWPSPMSWSDAMRHFAAARERYMRERDSAEQRLCDKNPLPFRL